jgi:hypothetical protein
MAQTNGDIRARFAAALSALEELNEGSEIPVSIGKDVIGTVKPNDTDTIDHLKSLVNSSASKEAVITFLLGIGYPADQAEILFTILSRNNDLGSFASYIQNRTITISSLLGKVSDANSINSSIGVPGKASVGFYGMSWRTSPPMGPGEVWLSTVLAGGRRPNGSEKGDVIVDGTELEVKGPNGRLIGQSGYGDAKQMRVHFYNAMTNIAANLGHTDFTAIDSGKDNFWNVGKKSGEGIETNLKAISKLNKGFSSKDTLMISAEIINAFRNYLLNLDVSKYSGVLSNCIGKDGSINTDKWHAEILPMYFEYYHSHELFSYIAFTSSNGKFLLIDASTFRDAYNRGLINFTAAPSFTNGAGSQGGTYGITIK